MASLLGKEHQKYQIRWLSGATSKTERPNEYCDNNGSSLNRSEPLKRLNLNEEKTSILTL